MGCCEMLKSAHKELRTVASQHYDQVVDVAISKQSSREDGAKCCDSSGVWMVAKKRLPKRCFVGAVRCLQLKLLMRQDLESRV